MSTQILQWNANSLTAHGGELKHYIAQTHITPDVICIQESYFKKKTKFTLPGYNIVRRDRPDSELKGGLATLIKHGISYSVIDGPNNFESLTVTIKTHTNKLTIANIYHSPKATFDPVSYTNTFFNTKTALF